MTDVSDAARDAFYRRNMADLLGPALTPPPAPASSASAALA